MDVRLGGVLAVSGLCLACLVGCSKQDPASAPVRPPAHAIQLGMGALDGKADLEAVKKADVSILFVGNSHTMLNDVPNVVREMVEFLHPDKKVFVHYFPVGHLEDLANDPRCREEIETRPWKYVILQAQKISMRGTKDYSRQDGIAIAKVAKAQGAKVFYFCEWGRKGVDEEGPRTEKIYTEMAQDAGVASAPIGRAWDLALAQRPKLPLHAADGNHQSEVGAFLTACVLAGRIADVSPTRLAGFKYLDVSDVDRKFMAEMAAKALDN